MPDRAALYFYLGTFAALVAAGLGFPMPEEIPIVVAGAAVGHVSENPEPPPLELVEAFSASPQAGFPANLPWPLLTPGLDQQVEVPGPTPVPNRLRWYIMLPVCILGVVISDGLLYGIGRLFGNRLLKSRLGGRMLPPEKRTRIEGNFRKYGIMVLLFARFLPAIRSPIFIMAGVMRLSLAKFLLADGIYAIPGVSLLFFLAYWFGHHFTELVYRVEGQVARVKPLLILMAITAVAAYLVYHFFRHPVATGDPREEVPLIGGQVAAKMECQDRSTPVLQEGRWTCADGSEPGRPQAAEAPRSADGRPEPPGP